MAASLQASSFSPADYRGIKDGSMRSAQRFPNCNCSTVCGIISVSFLEMGRSHLTLKCSLQGFCQHMDFTNLTILIMGLLLSLAQ